MTQNYDERKQANEASRSKAEHHAEIWEAYEIELLEEGWADDETTLPEIAELIGRTIEACRQKHYELKQRTSPSQRAKSKPHTNVQWDKGWTSLEDMGF